MKQKLLIGVALVAIGGLAGYAAAGGMARKDPAPGMMGSNAAMNVDRHFIDQMIPHHDGAIAMAQEALERSRRPEILSLANGIIEAQSREIADMTAWYEQWFGEAPAASGHGMHMHGMEGDPAGLDAAADFDIEFLEQMIVHHEMAVMMAQMLLSGTNRAEMQMLADQIVTSQTREIEMMESWLTVLGQEGEVSQTSPGI
jgi:uncharacterized protein (DUF305 family)